MIRGIKVWALLHIHLHACMLGWLVCTNDNEALCVHENKSILKIMVEEEIAIQSKLSNNFEMLKDATIHTIAHWLNTLLSLSIPK